MTTGKGTRKKERIRNKKLEKYKQNYHRREGNPMKQTYLPRKPYLKRGRRVKFSRCTVCGEYFPKQVREYWDEYRRIQITETYIVCHNHGRTIVDTIKRRVD